MKTSYNLIVTQHAAERMAQRSIPLGDADLIALIGTGAYGVSRASG